MTALATSLELEPLASASLCRRFPNLRIATDRDLMRAHLQRVLLDGTGLVAESCARPKTEVDGGTCWLQYLLQVRTPSGDARDLLVLGTMFAKCSAAAAFHRTCLAPVATRLPSPAGPAPKPTGLLESLGMAVSVFPVNNRLPTLVDATNPQRFGHMLRPVLAPDGETAPIGVELVRFRLTRGCVLRYTLEAPGDRAVYGKVGYGAAADVMREGLDAVARCVQAQTRGLVIFPQVLGHSSDLDLTIINRLPGSSPDLQVDEVINTTIDRAALIAASLHTSDVAAGLPRSFDDELTRARQGVELIREHAAALAAWLTGVLESVDALAARTAAQPSGFAHGSFAPSQLMLDGPRTAILDFDRLCQAEPAFDIGRFLAPLRVTLGRQGNTSADRLASRFVEAYREAGGRSTPQDRVGAYEIAGLVRMATHSWQQLKVARLQSVCAILEQRVAQLGLNPL